jgi:Fungal protein kinase
MVPTETSKLTGGLTYEHRRGTLVDWNLCFTADGTSSNRSFRSGTPAFMAQDLLMDNKKLPRRTLGHDMESFFAIIIWTATFGLDEEKALVQKPLAELLLDNTISPNLFYGTRAAWFEIERKFQSFITDHFKVAYQGDEKFITCMSGLRQILYASDRHDITETGNDDPEEEVFRECMKTIDCYLCETKGCDEMEEIDSQAQSSRINIRKSVGQEEMDTE